MFAAIILSLDLLQENYGGSSVTWQMISFIRDKGLLFPDDRREKSESLRKAVNRALIESGVHKSDMIFGKRVDRDAPDEYEYREFKVASSVSLESLQKAIEKAVVAVGARTVSKETRERSGKRIVAIDLGFGRVKRQCLLLMQSTDKGAHRTESSGPGDQPAASSAALIPIDMAPKGELEATSSVGTVQPRASLALIVDDCGQSLSLAKRLLSIDCPLTLSVLPDASHAKRTALLAKQSGFEVMLHLPMEPIQRVDPVEVELQVRYGAAPEEIASIVSKALNRVPGASGVNNHEGSKACTDPIAMAAVMEGLLSRNLYFVDSRTTAETVAFTIATKMGLRTAERDMFLDNYDDVQTIGEELDRLVALSIRLNRPVVGICHLRPNTVRVLQLELPRLKKAGHQFLFASQVVH